MAGIASTKAIFLGPDGELTVKQIEETYTPRGTQSLVQVTYSAINPADIKHSYMGLSGSVAGYEWTATVRDVGDSSPFSIGQKVFGISMPGSRRPIYAGAHQEYILAERYMTWALPDDLDPKSAVAMPLGMQTAADALFNMLGFGFPSAGVDGDRAVGVPILIWGGSSTVGLCGIQLAKAAGFSPIFTTASSKNHDTLRRLGADFCFDYNSPNIVEDIRKAVTQSGARLTTVYDGVSAGLGVFEPPSKTKDLDFMQSTPYIARQCCSVVESEELRLCGVLPVAQDPTWKFCIATRLPGDTTLLGGPQDPSFPGRVEKVMNWIISNHGLLQLMPNVTVVQGAVEAIKQMNRVYDGKVSMEKVVIARPL